MDTIIKHDVRTYVQELIKKELSSKNNKEEVHSNIGKTNAGDNRYAQHHPFLQYYRNARTVTDLGD